MAEESDAVDLLHGSIEVLARVRRCGVVTVCTFIAVEFITDTAATESLAIERGRTGCRETLGPHGVIGTAAALSVAGIDDIYQVDLTVTVLVVGCEVE